MMINDHWISLIGGVFFNLCLIVQEVRGPRPVSRLFVLRTYCFDGRAATHRSYQASTDLTYYIVFCWNDEI